MSYTIGELIKDPKPPVTVTKTDTIVYAVGLMRQHDYSQLPVVDGENRPIGIVTSDSILRSLDFLGSGLDGLLVSHAMQQTIPKLKLDDFLSVLQNRLLESYAALITDDDNKLIGIVTNYDTAKYYRGRANDLMLIEEIESSLRDHVQAAFRYDTEEINKVAQHAMARQRQLSPEKLQAAIRRYLEAIGISTEISQEALNKAMARDQNEATRSMHFADLPLNDLISLLFLEPRWQDYSTAFGGIDKTHLRSVLNKVRDIRNVLAHFKRELTAEDQHLLNWCTDFLALHRPLQPAAIGPVATETIVPSDRGNRESTQDGARQANSVEVQNVVDDSKYSLLYGHLVGMGKKAAVVTLSFEEIEKIVQSRLPSSARELRAWWANDQTSHSQAKYWLEADWRVVAVDRDEQTVTFARMTEREAEYSLFFARLAALLEKKHGICAIASASTGSRVVFVSRITDSSGKQNASFGFAFAQGGMFRSLFLIHLERRELTEWAFSRLEDMKAEIAADYGDNPSETLIWQMRPDARSALIYVQAKGSIQDNEIASAQLQEWAADSMARLQKAFTEHFKTIIAHLPAG